MGWYENYESEKNKNSNNIDIYNNWNVDFHKKNEEELSLFEKRLDDWAKYLAYFRFYPDRFIDWINPPDSKFKFFHYQREYLRLMFRYREVFITATRGTSKSFLEILAKYLQCIFYPGLKTFIVAPGNCS